MAKATVRLSDGYQAKITSRHHTYYADEPVSAGGQDSGPSPSEMIMGALGACMAITIKMYAERKKWPLEGVEIALDYERFKGADYADYEGDAAFIHEIREAITLHGPLDTAQKERLLEIGSRCPVRRLIEMPVFFKEEAIESEV